MLDGARFFSTNNPSWLKTRRLTSDIFAVAHIMQSMDTLFSKISND